MALAMFFWKTLKNRSNEICSNEIHIRRGSPVFTISQWTTCFVFKALYYLRKIPYLCQNEIQLFTLFLLFETLRDVLAEPSTDWAEYWKIKTNKMGQIRDKSVHPAKNLWVGEWVRKSSKICWRIIEMVP